MSYFFVLLVCGGLETALAGKSSVHESLNLQRAHRDSHKKGPRHKKLKLGISGARPPRPLRPRLGGHHGGLEAHGHLRLAGEEEKSEAAAPGQQQPGRQAEAQEQRGHILLRVRRVS